jgi:hypothetical protein
MRNTLALIVGVCLCSVSGIGGTSTQQVRPVSAAATSMEEVLTAVRTGMQTERADIIAKNVTLTSEQAARFWPLFASYQKEQNAIMDDQLRDIQRYIEEFESLDDAGALGLINAHFARDARMNAVRQQWLGEFQKALGAKLAVRVMQIDRRLSLVHQLQFAAKIPLAD